MVLWIGCNVVPCILVLFSSLMLCALSVHLSMFLFSSNHSFVCSNCRLCCVQPGAEGLPPVTNRQPSMDPTVRFCVYLCVGAFVCVLCVVIACSGGVSVVLFCCAHLVLNPENGRLFNSVVCVSQSHTLPFSVMLLWCTHLVAAPKRLGGFLRNHLCLTCFLSCVRHFHACLFIVLRTSVLCCACHSHVYLTCVLFCIPWLNICLGGSGRE